MRNSDVVLILLAKMVALTLLVFLPGFVLLLDYYVKNELELGGRFALLVGALALLTAALNAYLDHLIITRLRRG